MIGEGHIEGQRDSDAKKHQVPEAGSGILSLLQLNCTHIIVVSH